MVSPRQPEVCRGLVPAVVAKHLCKSLLTCPLSKTPHPADFQRRVQPMEAAKKIKIKQGGGVGRGAGGGERAAV